MIKGIDVSIYQPDINWAKVKEAGINFAIIKAGGSECGRFEDRTFRYNYQNAKANGIKIGTYFMGGKGFTSGPAGIADANYFLQIISGLAFEFPCFIDLELPTSVTRDGNTDACIAFCETVKAAGFKTGIYASDISGFKDRLDITRITAYDKWVARYGSEPKYVADYDIWQYSSNGSVSGISGRVDMNYSKKNYEDDTPEAYFFMGEDFGPVFDPEYYANRYADLEAAFGFDHAALWNHFITFGMWERRQASQEFNPEVYIARYADLRNAYGEYFPLYYWHYCHFGKSEGRIAS